MVNGVLAVLACSFSERERGSNGTAWMDMELAGGGHRFGQSASQSRDVYVFVWFWKELW